MVPLGGLHGERDRAESFGSAAERYDRYRPGYPSALIDELMSLNPATALDVGCGTGKVALSLMGRGLPVLGVEPDARMAEVAQRNNVPVEVASFESWESAGRSYRPGDRWTLLALDRPRGWARQGGVDHQAGWHCGAVLELSRSVRARPDGVCRGIPRTCPGVVRCGA